MITANGMLLFHHRSEIYSNWFLRDFTMRGLTFSCVEQPLMYAKAKLFGDEVRAAKIMATPDPADHKAQGRLVEGYVEKVWVAKRRPILRHSLYAKFTQHNDLKDSLLGTDDLELVEASGTDLIYGCGCWENNPRIYDKRNWRGESLLGLELMCVRAQIRLEVDSGVPHRQY